MSTGGYDPPVRVSPLIRGARWVMLISGIFYGISKKRLYTSWETKVREQKAIDQVHIDAALAEKKREKAAIEAEALALLSPPKNH